MLRPAGPALYRTRAPALPPEAAREIMGGMSPRPSLTNRLAALCARPVDDATRARAALHVLDWFGCALLGATAEAGSILIEYARGQAPGPCLTLGAGTRDASTAAFTNGGLGNIFEMDDLHRTSIVHPGDVVIPAALAVAERDGADARAFLDALVRGYEVSVRIGIAAGPGHYRHWYNTATCGVFGAAAAVASLHGLDTDATTHALGQAGAQAAGTWQCRMEPTHSKQLETARAAQSGLVAADLARLGLAGASEILEGAHGFFAATCPDANQDAVLAEPEAEWKIHQTSFKPWPACRHAHPVIEAALELRDGLPLDRVKGVTVTTYRDAVDFCDNPTPKTPHEARFSLQYCVAVALNGGAPGLAEFEPAAIADPATAPLRELVTVREDAAMTKVFPENYGARLTVTLDDGTVHDATVETARGDPENPMSRTEIEAKAQTLMRAGGLGKARAERLAAACLALAEGGKPAALAESLADDLRTDAAE